MGLNLSAIGANIIAQKDLLKSGFMHLPYVSQVNDTTIRLRDDAFMSCIRVEGLDALTTPARELDALKSGVASVIAQMGEDFAIYTHKVSRRVDLCRDLDPLNKNDFAAAVDQRWSQGLAKAQLRDTSITITVVKTNRLKRTAGILQKASSLLEGHDTTRDLELIEEVVRFLRSAIGLEQTRVLSARKGELLGFLNSLQTANEQPVYPSGGLTVLADDVLSERITFEGSGFTLTDGPEPDRFGEIRAIKNYPPASWVTIFDEFALPCDYVITQSFLPMSSNRAAELVEKKRRIMASTADVRAQAAEQLASLHEGVLVQEVSLGHHHFTITLLHENRDDLKSMMSELEGAASNKGVRMVRDVFARRAHYFAQFPGNLAMRPRVNIITNTHFADFASLHRTPLGKTRGDLPWETPIAVFPTRTGSPYRFSFHKKGDATSEPSAGHTLILGETGSGKSVLASLLMAQSQRADTRVIVFDYRKGLEMTVRALRGSYSVIESGKPTGLNPLWVETDEEGVDWLAAWLTQVLPDDTVLSEPQAKAILDRVRQNANAKPDLRNWSDFAKLFAATDDDGVLRSLANAWAPGGRFGWVFGQTTQDTFSLEGNVSGFDLTQILDAQTDRERMAVLSYIFRRIERKMRDKNRTIVVIDEAWKAIDNPYFANVIEGWLATLRKQNAVVVMLSQNPDQLAKSKVGERIFSFFPTQILFPDRKSAPQDYAALRLNEAELAIVTSRVAGRAFLLRDDEHSVVLDGDASPLGNLLHILGGGTAGLSVVGEDYREQPDFWRQAHDR